MSKKLMNRALDVLREDVDDNKRYLKNIHDTMIHHESELKQLREGEIKYLRNIESLVLAISKLEE